MKMRRRAGSPDAVAAYEIEFDQWMTVPQASISFRKSIRTIRNWCNDGTFFDAGIEVKRDLSGNWLIHVNAPRAVRRATTA